MRRITMWVVSTVAALVLLFSYRTSTGGTSTAANVPANAPGVVSGPSLDATPAPADTPVPTPSPGSPSPTGSATPVPAPKSTTPSKSQATVANGTVAQTRWGPVQVQVRISGGKITDVSTLQLPSGNERDQEINSSAVPQLRQQALTAQSAHIDGVSGATVTSDGYRTSLQAALDAAHFKA
jgi:uncharacterized protein with FMN-binding domain